MARLVAGDEFRRRWPTLLLLGLLATVWGGSTMAAIAGARRTASVVDRFLHATQASDASFAITDDRDGRELLSALRARPEVSAADVVWSATTAVAYADDGLFASVAVGLDGRWGRDFDRPIVLRGRMPHPTDPTEVAVNQAASAVLGVGPGDHLELPTWDKAKYDAWFLTRGAFPPFDGPLIDVVVVGVISVDNDLTANQDGRLAIRATPAFVDRWQTSVGDNTRSVAVKLRDPDANLDALVESLTASLGKPVSVTTTDVAYASATRDATRTSVVALVALAISIAVTGALVVVAGVAREIRRAAAQVEPLRALGATPLQQAVAVSSPIAVVAVLATCAAVVLANVVSGRFPVGPGRLAEPDPGLRFDVPVLAGSMIVSVVMLATSLYFAVRPAHPRSGARGHRARPHVALIRLGPAATVGCRNALAPRGARATLAFAVVTIAGLTATAWLARSLEGLDDHPEHWGYTWSSSPELGVPSDEFPALLNETARDPAIISVASVVWEALTINGSSVTVRSFETMHGRSMEPTVLAGRLPWGAHEIALGERTARRLGVDIGESVTIATADASATDWRVVGFVVPPSLLGSSQPGEGAYVERFNQSAIFGHRALNALMALAYQPGVDRHAVEARLADAGWSFIARSRPLEPGAVGNLVDTSVLVTWLSAYFLVLGGVTTLLAAARHGTRQSRDLRVLRALGFTRRDVLLCVASETLTVLTVGLVVGVAAGLATGRVVWKLTTDSLGIVNPQPSPALAGAGVLVLSAVSAITVWVFAAQRAVTVDAGDLLRED